MRYAIETVNYALALFLDPPSKKDVSIQNLTVLGSDGTHVQVNRDTKRLYIYVRLGAEDAE